MISRTGVLPTDPAFLALSANEELLHYTAYWLQKKETENFDKWAKMLGVVWTRDQIASMSGKTQKATAPNEIFIPLAQAINPELFDGLKKMFRVSEGSFIGGGEYTQSTGEEVVNLGDLPREEFIEWANQATGVMKKAADHFEAAERTLTINEGAGPNEDPKMQRIRDQITASKRFR